MRMRDLTNRWSLPDRSGERVQVTLRLDFNEYARLHALKEMYPNRSVNDFLNDIIRAGLDEIVDSMPSYVCSADDAIELAGCPGYPDDPNHIVGTLGGLRVRFDRIYGRILGEKVPEDSLEDSKSAKASVLKVVGTGEDVA